MMRPGKLVLLFSLFIIAEISPAISQAYKDKPLTDKQLFVSVNGNDNNTGTIKTPFKSLGKALSASRQYPGKRVSIQLRGGTYYFDKTIVLRPEDVLTRSLTITAYHNEKVIISAGRRLNLQWKPFRNDIFQANVPAGVSFERLYINGSLQQMARYPNYDSTARVFNGTAADAISPERVKLWKNPVGGYVHALHSGEWGGFEYLITGVDADGKLQLKGGWQNNRPAPMHKQLRFVENIFEELDAPGEWYLDKDKHILYYYPAKSIKLTGALVEVSHLKNTFELKGTASNPLKNICINGLTFEHNERSFMDTKEPLLRGDWTIYRGGAILFEGTENCKITNCSFKYIGGNAIMLSNYNLHDTISRCLVAHIGANAVCFIGDPKAVRSPLFKYENSTSYNQLDKTPGPLTNNYPQACVVTNNLFHHMGEIEKQAGGVEIAMSAEITVSHNTIYNTPRAGINVNDGCWGGHIIAYNDVFNTVMETGDNGAYNSWGRDRYWSPDRRYMDSIVQAQPELILLDAQKQNVIHDNRFRCDHGWDIDLDDGSTNYHIYNNVCLNGGLKLREGFYRIVENNIIINNSFHPHVWFANSGDVFEHNLVFKKYFPIGITDWGKKIDYNLFPDTAALNASKRNGTDAHSLAGEVKFLNAATGNFTVTGSSPAYSIGFHNIPMDEFGVQDSRLKKLALTAPIPALLTNTSFNDKTAIVSFLGGRIKSVDGLGERSAYGLPDETGVIVVNTGQNTLLAKSGLMNKDVIVATDDKKIKEVKDLMELYQSENWQGKITLTIIRNQQQLNVMLFLK